MSGSDNRTIERAYFDKYVDLVPVSSPRRVNFLPQMDGPRLGATAIANRYGRLIGFVILPTFLAAIYFLILAADRYESETRFAVRRASPPASGVLSELLQSSGPVRATDEAYAVAGHVAKKDYEHHNAAYGAVILSRVMDMVRTVPRRDPADRIAAPDGDGQDEAGRGHDA